MCSVGDSFNLDISELESDLYKCLDCSNEFKSVGKRVLCPTCHSKKVQKIEKEA